MEQRASQRANWRRWASFECHHPSGKRSLGVGYVCHTYYPQQELTSQSISMFGGLLQIQPLELYGLKFPSFFIASLPPPSVPNTPSSSVSLPWTSLGVKCSPSRPPTSLLPLSPPPPTLPLPSLPPLPFASPSTAAAKVQDGTKARAASTATAAGGRYAMPQREREREGGGGGERESTVQGAQRQGAMEQPSLPSKIQAFLV